ncbi:hypothetical protein [Melon chlorotic spot virus]|uniref:Uncharacterized protein n=1 Tax=Melon chlorotic spot virus TaxID=2479459 RepID=A0A3G1Z310_9VIRU|nr:hypothetical protein [Melon chlorotic spot virus]AYL40777.1 hypothetical protein [Melon chlorotic spot virus]
MTLTLMRLYGNEKYFPLSCYLKQYKGGILNFMLLYRENTMISANSEIDLLEKVTNLAVHNPELHMSFYEYEKSVVQSLLYRAEMIAEYRYTNW